MRSVLRSVAAIVAGFIAASIVMMIVEFTNSHVLYPELAKAAEGVTDREEIRILLASAPMGALLVVIVGWFLGGVVGGWVSARLAAHTPAAHGLGLGGLLTLASIANNMMLPPPLWFWVASVLVLMPAAIVGIRLAGDR